MAATTVRPATWAAMDDAGGAVDGDAGGVVDGVKQPASRPIPAVDAGLPRSAEHRQAGLR